MAVTCRPIFPGEDYHKRQLDRAAEFLVWRLTIIQNSN